MKAKAKIFILFLAINSFILMAPQRAAAQVSISFQTFYDDLSPYGDWIDTPEYGYVWIPDVSDAFIPYRTNGYWVSTNIGWTWVSNYRWGWAPFHYGRWYYDSYYGWIWVPGYDWGPGWVTWRRAEGYYGWAPLAPGISITIAFSSGYRLPYNYWTYIRDRDFGRSNSYNYYVPLSNNRTIVNKSTVINNSYRDNSTKARYYSGPERSEVQRQTGRTISPLTLRERNTPGHNLNNKEMQIYRPRVEKRGAAERKLAPSKVIPLKEVKPTGQKPPSRRENLPARQQESQRQDNNQPIRQQQQPQQQRDNQSTKQQQRMQQEARNQQAKQQQTQRAAQDQQARQQQTQRAAQEQQVRQQQMQRETRDQQARQQQTQRAAQEQQARQQQRTEPRAKPQQNQKQTRPD